MIQKILAPRLQKEIPMKFVLIGLLFVSCATPLTSIDNPFEQAPDSTTYSNKGRNRLLKIIVINVGQGDATLVIGPDQTTLLIDGGPAETGASKVLETLNEEDTQKLNWVIASHYDLDHIGGLPAVLAGFAVEAVLDRGDLTNQDLPLFFGYLDRAGPLRQEAEPGLEIPLGDGATATVIVVNGNYADGRSIHLNPDEENEASIGLLIRYGSFEYFTAGDLTGGGAPGGYESKEMETWAGEIIGDIDILHAGHHGSATSTNERFLELTRPEEAVISVGKENDYGHPTQTVLNRFNGIGTAIYRTDEDGTIEIRSDGTNYEIRSAVSAGE